VAAICSFVTSASLRADDPPRIVAYYTAWSIYARNYNVTQIDADRLTHINYAFANIRDGECVLGDPWADVEKTFPGDTWDQPLRGNFNQLRLLKERHPHVRTLIAVGGWTWSTPFSAVALTTASRERFARSCVDFMTRYGFDGVDLDWEYPGGGGAPGNRTRPEDPENFTRLLAELRRQIDARGSEDDRDYLLTIAAGAGPEKIANLELERIHEHVDWINVMTYDFHGGWERTTNFNAPLYASPTEPPGNEALNAHAAIQAYLDGGVPAAKLHLGVPFYGRGWRDVPNASRGLYQESGGPATGTWEAGVFDYSDIVENWLPVASRQYHAEASVPWIWHAERRVFIGYDDERSLAEKVNYVREHELGGVMAWELSGDDDDHTLLEVLRNGLDLVDGVRFIRGDCNGDESINVSDAVLLLNHLFGNGPAPLCMVACDTNGNGNVASDIADAIYGLNFAYLGGPPPAPPHPECGVGTLESDAAIGCVVIPEACR